MRIRIKFSKAGAMQYVGHLDLHRSWERTFRRARLPLEYSQGFHPQPHLNLACALPVGFTSQCELLDAWLVRELMPQDVMQALSGAVPPGLEIIEIAVIEDRVPALQTQVLSSIYLITFLDNIPDLNDRVSKIINSAHLPRVRHDKPYDLRPLIEAVDVLTPIVSKPQIIQVQLAAHEGATGRPEELLDEMGIGFENTLIHREKLLLLTN
jgi:radical SAM-linked protein